MSEQKPTLDSHASRTREEQQRRERAVEREKRNATPTAVATNQPATERGSSSRARSPVVALQQRAGNRAVSSLLRPRSRIGRLESGDAPDVAPLTEADEQSAERDADRVAERLVLAWGASNSGGAESSERGMLPPRLRLEAERELGLELGDVRLHADHDAQRATDRRDAQAMTTGRDIYFGAGRLDIGSRAGRVLLGHELAHVAQQATVGAARTQRKPDPKKKPKPKRVVREIMFVDVKLVVFVLEDDTTKTGKVEFEGAGPAPGNYTHRLIKGAWHTTPDPDTQNTYEGATTYLVPSSATLEGVTAIKMKVYAGKPRTTATGGSKLSGQVEDTGGPASDSKKIEIHASDPKAKDEKPRELTEEEKKLWKSIVEMTTGTSQPDDTPAKEQLRLFELLRERVEELYFGKEGEPWTKFAKFLERNKDKIEGILRLEPEGTLTEEKIQRIIDQYGKFVASEEKEAEKNKDKKEGAGDTTSLETPEDFDKEFKYDPGWAKLSKKDRELMVELAKLDPDAVSDKPIDFTSITTSMKVSIALKLSWASWPGETAAAAKAAFSDATFLITLVVMMGIYVGLWITPDPFWVTKLAAGTLTAALLVQFALEDIVGFALAYSEMTDECAFATTAGDLQAAGDKFAKKVGQVGFDIILMIVMWRIGKAASKSGKVTGWRKAAAERGVKRAQATVDTAAAKPGSGTTKMADPAKPKLLETAKSKAKGSTPTAVLDALEGELTPDAKKGLRALRDKANDSGAYRSMESRTKDGVDLDQHLREVGMSDAAKAQAKLNLLKAEAKLARAKLIEAETLRDPQLRQAALDEAVRKLKARLSELNIFDDSKVKRAAQGTDLKDMIGALAEAIQRTQLKPEAARIPKGSVVSNLAVARRIPGFKTIAEWKAAELAAGRDGKTAGHIQYQEQVYKLEGEVDATIMQETKPGEYKPVAMDETKGGSADQPVRARAQLDKVTTVLGELAQGSTDLRVFQMADRYTVGSDWTWKLDLSAIDSVTKTTRGPEGKGFDQSLGYDADVLAEVAKSILKDGLPPKPTPALPPTGRRDKEEKTAPR